MICGFPKLVISLKYNSPVSLYELLIKSSRINRLNLRLPHVRLEKSKQNFVFSASNNWNNLLDCVFERCVSQSNGIVILGSNKNSDLSSSIAFVKSKLSKYLINNQKSGHKITWL